MNLIHAPNVVAIAVLRTTVYFVHNLSKSKKIKTMTKTRFSVFLSWMFIRNHKIKCVRKGETTEVKIDRDKKRQADRRKDKVDRVEEKNKIVGQVRQTDKKAKDRRGKQTDQA